MSLHKRNKKLKHFLKSASEFGLKAKSKNCHPQVLLRSSEKEKEPLDLFYYLKYCFFFLFYFLTDPLFILNDNTCLV